MNAPYAKVITSTEPAREVIPMSDSELHHSRWNGRTIATTEPSWPERPGAKHERPNVIVILVDDMGFSDISCFGSEIPTPAIDTLARSGTRFSNFHVTPLCSPTRASLLTGANHHRVGYAFVANTDPGVPNRSAKFPAGCQTMAERLRTEGYATAAVGKWHLTPEVDMRDAGSREMWPCQRGFDRFYGFLEALTTPLNPHRLISDNSAIDIEEYTDGYYLTDDLTDRAIEMMRTIRANDPEKPFFLYFAHAAVHGPLQAKPEDIERFSDAYRAGWSQIAQDRFERQLDLGLFPKGTQMADRENEPGREVPDWESLTDSEQELFARMMAVYAGMVHSVDRSTGRLLEALDELGERENTVILFLSDNGATAEGGPRGTQEYFKTPPLAARQEERVSLPVSDVGGPRSAMHYPRGWAMVSNTPFRLFKASAHEGAVRSPLIVSWPKRFEGGDICDNFQYVTDILPTVLEFAEVPLPDTSTGGSEFSIDGVSFADAVFSPTHPGSRDHQHEEVAGQRSYVRRGWKAVTRHAPRTSFDADRWELYHLDDDPGEVRDLAFEHEDLVDELRRGWEESAERNGVFPLDEGSGLAMALRNPDEQRFREPLTLRQGTPTLERFRASLLTNNRSFDVDIDFDSNGDAGVLVAHGGQTGGYVIFVEDDSLNLHWNDYGIMRVGQPIPLHAGRHVARLSVVVGANRSCQVSISTGNAASTISGLTSFLAFAPFDGIDIGIDRRSPVSWDVRERHGAFRYSGTIHGVTYLPGQPAPDAPELRIAQMRAEASRFQ